MAGVGEVRVVNSQTGGQKGSKKARFDLIPGQALTELAEHYGAGSEKYEDRNWELGYNWSLSFAALMRHAWQFWNGEDLDEETGSKHMIAVAWHALALAHFMDHMKDLDDRPAYEDSPVYGGIDPEEETENLLPPATFRIVNDVPPVPLDERMLY